MDNDLMNISLNQGKKFKNYQGKIQSNVEKQIHNSKSKRVYKKKEGFTMPVNIIDNLNGENDDPNDLIQKRDERGKSIAKANQADLDKSTMLQNKYNDLQLLYNTKQQNMNTNSLVSINRTSSTNPYLNKNIHFTTGHVCYVTNQGVVKWIPYGEIWNTLITFTLAN